jgi:hypothetical protein
MDTPMIQMGAALRLLLTGARPFGLAGQAQGRRAQQAEKGQGSEEPGQARRK